MNKIFPYIVCWMGLFVWAGYFSASAIQPPIPPPSDDFESRVVIQLPISLQDEFEPPTVKSKSESWGPDHGAMFLVYFLLGAVALNIIVVLLWACFGCDGCVDDPTHPDSWNFSEKVNMEGFYKAPKVANLTKDEQYEKWHKELQEFIDSIPQNKGTTNA